MNGIRTNGSRITPLAVASGAIASFDAQVAAPLKILKADINPVQAGSGDPSPDNIRPISGWDEIKTTNESGEIFEAANIVATESEIKAYYDVDLVLTAGTYVFSTDATDSVTLIGAQYYSGSWVNLFTQIGTSRKFTLSRSGKCHFRVELRGSGDLSSNTVSLKKLTEITIEFEDTVYGGTLDITSGKGIINKQYVKVASFNSIATNSLGHKRVSYSLNGCLNAPAAICNCFKYTANYNYGQINTFYNSPNLLYFVFDEDEITTLNDANAWLNDHEVEVIYPIRPVEFIIDPDSMITFAGSNKITTDSGNTTACYLKGVTT